MNANSHQDIFSCVNALKVRHNPCCWPNCIHRHNKVDFCVKYKIWCGENVGLGVTLKTARNHCYLDQYWRIFASLILHPVPGRISSWFSSQNTLIWKLNSFGSFVQFWMCYSSYLAKILKMKSLLPSHYLKQRWYFISCLIREVVATL